MLRLLPHSLHSINAPDFQFSKGAACRLAVLAHKWCGLYNALMCQVMAPCIINNKNNVYKLMDLENTQH